MRALADRVGGAAQARWVEAEAARRHPRDPQAAADAVEAIAADVESGEPLQYALGRWEFRGLELLVDARALIPRPETEQVVELALALLDAGPAGCVVDLGTGSGAMALSIASERRDRRVVATDASSPALELAAQNARSLGLPLELHEGSWFEALPAELRGGVALLISNPPYVPEAAYEGLAPELHREPRSALTAAAASGGVEGGADLEAIATQAAAWLAPGGAIVLEHGEEQGEWLAGLLPELGFTGVRTELDLAGKVRATTAKVAP